MTEKPPDKPDRSEAIKQLEAIWVNKQSKKQKTAKEEIKIQVEQEPPAIQSEKNKSQESPDLD